MFIANHRAVKTSMNMEFIEQITIKKSLCLSWYLFLMSNAFPCKLNVYKEMDEK